jgi:hypothetical protein
MSEIKRLLSGFTRWKVGFRWYFWAAFLILGPLAITLIYRALGNPGIVPGETVPSMGGRSCSPCSRARLPRRWAGAVLPFPVYCRDTTPSFRVSFSGRFRPAGTSRSSSRPAPLK